MFLKLQKLLSQQAVLIKTMFHLFFDDYKLSLQWKKNFFSARKIIPPCGQTDSSQRGIQAFVSGIWKVPSLADHAFLCSWSSQMLVLNAVTIRNFPKAQLHCHCLKTHRPPRNDGFPAWKKKKTQGFSGKVLLLLSPGASLLSFLLILNNLVSIPHITQISQKKHLEQPPAE